MLYVIAVLLPPLATLLAGRIGATIINVILWAIIVAISVMIVVPTMGIGLILMLIPIIHAWAVVSSAKQDKKLKKMEKNIKQANAQMAQSNQQQ